MLGSAIATFFAIDAYMGRILGKRDELASLDIALALFNRGGMAGSIAMLRVADAWVGRTAPLAGPLPPRHRERAIDQAVRCSVF